MGNRGFTLLELLAALAVASILVLGTSGIFVFITRAGKDNDAQAYLQRQAALLMDEMARQIRPATSLVDSFTCGPGAGTPNSLLVTQADGTRYCFRGDATGTGFWRDHYAPGAATPDGSWNLLAGAPVTLTTAGSPTLVVVNSRRAVITFQLQYQIPGSPSFQTMTFSTTIARRNDPVS